MRGCHLFGDTYISLSPETNTYICRNIEHDCGTYNSKMTPNDTRSALFSPLENGQNLYLAFNQ